MLPFPRGWLAVLVLLAACAQHAHQARITVDENGVKTAVYLSPKLTQQPGSVANKSYFDIDFPRGHIGIKSFNGELVDDGGNPIPLHQTYMHHWLVIRYYIRKGQNYPHPDLIVAGNSGVCTTGLWQNFGVGSETRKTDTYVPDPYGIEFGNPAEIPQGYEETWVLVLHAIDTRGTQDKLGCTECRCNLYNVTDDEFGLQLNPNYEGGLHCCYDKTQCRLKERFQSVERNLYMRYTVKWVDWDSSIIPVKIYLYDVTDTWKKSDGPTGSHDCPNEYDIEPCSGDDIARDRCIDTKRVIVNAPSSGDIIYGVGHQHIGGTGIALYGEDGRVLCSSVPIYGKGNEAGNEAGYIVGMSTCYPLPGSVKMSYGETIVLESNYSSSQKHTGVMGIFYILVAEHSLELDSRSIASTQIDKKSAMPNYIWIQVMFGVVISTAIAAIVVFAYRRTNMKEDRYESLVIGE